MVSSFFFDEVHAEEPKADPSLDRVCLEGVIALAAEDEVVVGHEHVDGWLPQ